MTATFADQEIWHVLVASDDMKRMNVDQLDDAFRLSLVDASTLVWKAGMKTWQSLGSVAGLEEEEPQTVTRQVSAAMLAQVQPAPPPRSRPAPRLLTPLPSVRPAAPPPPAPPRPIPRSLPPSPPRPAPPPAWQSQQVAPFAAAPWPSQQATPFAAAPSYVPPLVAPDPYALPQRRRQVSTEVNFRRRPGGRRVGRWVVGLVLVTTAVLACYRQNLLREGARRVGLENKYLYGEKRATAFAMGAAPRPVRDVLTRLSLLPGPNAAPPAAAALTRAPAPTPARVPTPSVAEETQPAKLTSPTSDPKVTTVALDSLPVLRDASVAEPAPPAKSVPAPRAAALKSTPAPRRAVAKSEPPPARKASKAESQAARKSESKPVTKAAPPSANEGFLKAAIRSAIAADSSKRK